MQDRRRVEERAFSEMQHFAAQGERRRAPTHSLTIKMQRPASEGGPYNHGLLLRAGLRWDQAIRTVVDDELAVMLAGVLDETVSEIVEAV